MGLFISCFFFFFLLNIFFYCSQTPYKIIQAVLFYHTKQQRLTLNDFNIYFLNYLSCRHSSHHPNVKFVFFQVSIKWTKYDRGHWFDHGKKVERMLPQCQPNSIGCEIVWMLLNRKILNKWIKIHSKVERFKAVNVN